MSVDLNNLNISLDNFNAVASGKYNIGQIKLNEEGTGVYRTNSHKTFTIFNSTEISQEEAVAVKEAFCRAVKFEAKLDDAAVQELKEKLGIGSEKFSSMRAGNMKALTAAEVREVIDTYAEQINKRRTEGPQLKTSADLYKGASQKTLDSRAAARDKVNEQTLAKFAPSEADRSLNSILDFMDYEGGESVSNDTKKLTVGIHKCLEYFESTTVAPGTKLTPYKKSPVTLVVKNDMTFSATLKLDNGSDFSIDLGLTQKQLLGKVKDMLASLGVDERFAKDLKKVAGEQRLVQKPVQHPQGKTVKKAVDPLLMTKPEVDALKTEVLKSLKDSFETIKTIDDRKNPKALVEFREEKVKVGDEKKKRMEKIVEDLQAALVAVRGHDPRNALLVNRVRDVFHHDANAATNAPVDKKALCDKLYEDISEVLNKERTSLRDVVDKDIENLGNTYDTAKPQTQLDEDKDDLPALNINQLTGYDGE